MTDQVQSESERIAEVERQLLGCVMQPDDAGGEALDDAAELLTPPDFSVHAHQLVFETCLELRAANAPVTPVAIFERLSTAEKISELGSSPAEWLADRLTSGVIGHARYYAGLIRESADKRRFRHAAGEITHIAHESNRPAADSIAEAEQILFSLTDCQKLDQAINAGQLVRDGLEKIDERIGRDEPDGLQTGFPDIDFFLGGLKPGNLVVVGARPSAGKTALAIAIATNAACSGIPVHFASLEMSRTEITDRILSMRSGVPLKTIQTGRMPDGRRLLGEQIDRIQSAADDFRKGPFYLDDNSNLTAARLASVVRRGVRRKGIKLVIVDYLQIMYPESEKDSRQLQVGTLARRIKQMARLCNVPVILLAQLNRETEKRSGSKPRLSDLRESGEIEAHADIVLLLNPQTDQLDDPAKPRLIDVIIAKNRNGPSGEVTLGYRGPVVRFESVAKG